MTGSQLEASGSTSSPFWYFVQRVRRGFSDQELWNLDHTIAKFALPRLKRYKVYTHAYPDSPEIPTPEKWDEILDKMIHSMEWIVEEKEWSAEVYRLTPEQYKAEYAKIQEGLELFGKYFRALWD